ncbi:MAG: HEAT repeat domain-containing protein [Cyanobacteria bacterium P01_D01_bin.1]
MTVADESKSNQGEPQAAPEITLEQAIANLRQTEDAGDRYYAAWWLGRFGTGTPEVISLLLDALEDSDARAPDGGFPLRRNAARALGKVGNPSVVPALIDALDCSDYYVREAATQSLEALNAIESVEKLVSLLSGGVDAAVEVPGKPHLVQPYNAVLEALGGLGDDSVIPVVSPFLRHPVVQVKNAAARAMYQLTGQGSYAETLVETLRCDDLQLRRSALLDLGEIGYLPAASAIAQTLAENSIKLIALKGLLEQEIASSQQLVSAQSREVMELMDSLL